MNNVQDFGAVGDGIHKDTTAIQAAIDLGGIVHFPPGVYLSGTLFLRSNGGLDLDPGAVLLASPDKEDYNADDFCPQNRVFASEQVSGAHFITAVEQHNISIRGGRIDGNRQAFFGEINPEAPHKFRVDAWRPGQMIFLCECENVTIENSELYHAPYWTCFLHGCENVNIHGLRIKNDQHTPNGDGIDIDCCRYVCISDCIIDSGDDCITLRGSVTPLKKQRDCEYVTITNCILSTNCNAFRIGVGTGRIHSCTISNIIFHNTRHAICFVSAYSQKSPGVLIEDISMSNLMINAERAIVLKTSNFGPTDEETPGKPIRRIAFRGLRGTVSRGSYITGSKENPIEDVILDDISLVCTGGEYLKSDEPRRKYMPMEFIPAAFYLEYTDNITFRNLKLDWKTESTLWKYGILTANSTNFSGENMHSGKTDCLGCSSQK